MIHGQQNIKNSFALFYIYLHFPYIHFQNTKICDAKGQHFYRHVITSQLINNFKHKTGTWHIANRYFFLIIYHKSLIQSKVTIFFKSSPDDQFYVRCMYCVIKCIKTKCVLKGKFVSSVFHSCNAKTQKTQICVTGPQCVNIAIIQVCVSQMEIIC
jgi:hypothetical protein